MSYSWLRGRKYLEYNGQFMSLSISYILESPTSICLMLLGECWLKSFDLIYSWKSFRPLTWSMVLFATPVGLSATAFPRRCFVLFVGQFGRYTRLFPPLRNRIISYFYLRLYLHFFFPVGITLLLWFQLLPVLCSFICRHLLSRAKWDSDWVRDH